MRPAILALAVVLGGCAGGDQPSEEGAAAVAPVGADPERATTQMTCGGSGPPFPVEILHEPGGAEQDDDPAAAALRGHLTGGEAAWMPMEGWKVAVREAAFVRFVAEVPGEEGSFAEVTVALQDGFWRVTGWGSCQPMVDVGPHLGVASFRTAPDVVLRPEMTEIGVLVTERACNSGEDALGRVAPPAIIPDADTVTVVFGVRPRGGSHTCPSNPETPVLLELPEPLGDRLLLDGSSFPPRDATTCPPIAVCS